MHTVPKLKQLIEQIAKKHAFDLSPTGAYLRLDLQEERLIVENIGANRISIAYQLILHGEWTSDPEIVVWTGHQSTKHPYEEQSTNQWVPTEFCQVKGGWKACAGFDPAGNMIAFFRHEWQAWLAEFTENVVVPNVIKQGWLEQGIKSTEPPPSYTVDEMRERGYLIRDDTDSSDWEVDDEVPF